MFLPSGEQTYVSGPSSGCNVACPKSSQSASCTSSPPTSSFKPGQSGFRKVCTTGEPSPCPIPGLGAGVLEMRVKEGSKIRNLLGFAMSRMQRGGGAGGQVEAAVTRVLFTGLGRAVTKTITCAEIMKRKVRGLHQVSKLQYRTVSEVWESQEGGGSRMTVHRTVPSICILLSKDPLDPQEPGYQPPVDLYSLLEERESGDSPEKRPLSPSSHGTLTNAKRACLEEGILSSPYLTD